MILLIYSSLIVASVLSVRTPRISYITKRQEVDIGSSTELECSVQFANEFPVLWVKRGDNGRQDLPISTNSALIVRDSRYSLRHDTGSSTYILQIKDLQEYDGGTYMCQVLIDITNRISAFVPLLVRKPPLIFDNSSRTMVVMQGSPVKLECYATGIPVPQVSWRRENNALLPTGGSIYSGNELRIPNTGKEDRGTYYCIAENGVGRGARRNINVEVEFKPFATALKSEVLQAQSYDAVLECRIEAYPPADINWIFRSESIVNNQNYRISQFTTDNQFTASVLAVLSINRRQYGNYTCRANNKLGESLATIQLKESYYPVCPPACDDSYYYSGVLELQMGYLLLLITSFFSILVHRVLT